MFPSNPLILSVNTRLNCKGSGWMRFENDNNTNVKIHYF